MDLEQHRGILETILSRAKDEEDVVKRLSNYMALLNHCYEEADEVRGYFTLILEEKGLDTLGIASLINKSGKRYASTRLTAKAEKRLAEVQARIERGDDPQSYAYELFTGLEARKSRDAANPLLTPIQIQQAKRTSRMMRAVRNLFKGAKVVGLALLPAFLAQKLSAASSAGAAGGVTATATAGAVATTSAAPAAGAGLAAVIPIAAGAAEVAAPVVAPIAGKVVAGWVATGLVFGATGVVAYEATGSKQPPPSLDHAVTMEVDEPQPEPTPYTGGPVDALPPDMISPTAIPDDVTTMRDESSPREAKVLEPDPPRSTHRSPAPTKSAGPVSVKTSEPPGTSPPSPDSTAPPKASPSSSKPASPETVVTPTAAQSSLPTTTPTGAPSKPLPSPTATPDPAGDKPTPTGSQAPPEVPTETPDPTPTASPTLTPTETPTPTVGPTSTTTPKPTPTVSGTSPSAGMSLWGWLSGLVG
ncbi:hypothetical protein [Nonomuraea sp. NPDC023979]|uniref:hypothetical protein n=1 Tax=Nonomuraea sp. NPDC023979 TaxID=3154796 RepID=UPI0033D7F9E5